MSWPISFGFSYFLACILNIVTLNMVTLISIVVLYVCFDKFLNILQGHTCLQFPSARELADLQVPQKCTKYQYQISQFVILSIKISKPVSEYQISKFQISEYQVSKFTPSWALVIAKTNINYSL